MAIIERLAKYWIPLVAVSLVLMLLTVFLAMFYAPLPATSVKTVDGLLSSIEGSRITVAGFVVEINIRSSIIADRPFQCNITLADFSDYSRYLEAARTGHMDDRWWIVEPLAVTMSGDVPSSNSDLLQSITPGSNISVRGEIGYLFGHSSYKRLLFDSPDDVVLLSSPGSAGLTTSPVAQKIFYFHMPSAWASYLGFFVTLIFSIAYLRTRNGEYDRIASSSAELGVLFATIAIVTGPIWAKQEWGVYWRWDDTKLVTTFVMWLVYIGYLMLRAAVSDQGLRSRVSAVYGILGFVTMPMSLLSARIAPLLRSSHPEVIASSTGSLSQEAGITIMVALLAFTLLFITMLIKRAEVGESEEKLEDLKRRVGGEE